MKLSDYTTIAFDCDGVILNSNKVKTRAFYTAALPYGEECALALESYHTSNGGISRYKKFNWFVNTFIDAEKREKVYESLLKSYESAVKEGLATCDFNEDLLLLKEKTPNANWLVVSGGAQKELHQLFKDRNLDCLFEGGIFGSPDSKETIFSREIERDNIKLPALFIGDSKYDFTSSTKFGLDFLFLSQWSEVIDWREFCAENDIPHVPSLSKIEKVK
ncbi:haloacid dehalogenase [Alteromonas sp. KUL156]|nr:haloacid dehalogenase [Alteromonas sp. KUL154]GFD98730.1 haloacid dehalogenase [Alteromonas sp. KUL156]